jgi:hypothetical protein
LSTASPRQGRFCLPTRPARTLLDARKKIHAHGLQEKSWSYFRSAGSAKPLTTVAKILALLTQAETASTWNATSVTVREARQFVEEFLLQLNHGIEH